MGELETRLRALANNGELTHFSLSPRAGKGGTVFHVIVTPASTFAKGGGVDADPVKAILTALDDLPKRFTKEKNGGLAKAFKKVTNVPGADPMVVEREPWDIWT